MCIHTATGQTLYNSIIQYTYLIIDRLISLMDENFDTRRMIYGDEVLGSPNLDMVAIARRYGSSAKFCGSGGAVFGVCPGLAAKVRRCV